MIAGAAALAAAGCFNPFAPTILTERITTTAPAPNTPKNAVRLFEWCWQNRGVEEYKELFTTDYVFISAGTDSAGNPSREIQARRDDEIQTAENMFVGSAERAPAADIDLEFDRNLVSFPDDRPGKDATWHQTIRTQVTLRVKIDDVSTYEVTGSVQFYLVRGDSAQIPAEFAGRGFNTSLRWFIDRWEDNTLGSESVVAGGSSLSAARPAARPVAAGELSQVTLAELKRYYLTSSVFRSRLAELRAGSADGRGARRQ